MDSNNIKVQLLGTIERVIGLSFCPNFVKIGNSSYRIELRDYEDYFFPLITLLVHTQENDKCQVELLIKKDTENFSHEKPYKRGEYDIREVFCCQTSLACKRLEDLIFKRLEDIFP